ncbi:hypothetical protein QQ045_009856 [Rhodiola kirilowii]
MTQSRYLNASKTSFIISYVARLFSTKRAIAFKFTIYVELSKLLKMRRIYASASVLGEVRGNKFSNSGSTNPGLERGEGCSLENSVDGVTGLGNRRFSPAGKEGDICVLV